MKKRFLLPLSCAALFLANTTKAQLIFSSYIPAYSCRILDINNSGTAVGVIDVTAQFIWKKGEEIVPIGSMSFGDQTLNVRIGEDNTKVYSELRNPENNKNEFCIYDTNSQSWSFKGGLGGNLDYYYSAPFAVTSDNSTVVGLSYTPAGEPRPFKWTENGGFINLGSLYPNTYSRADAISDNKSVVGGYQDLENGSRAGAYWLNGIESVIVDSNGSNVGLVRAISYDGSKIAGNPLWGKFPYILDRATGAVTYIKNSQLLTDIRYKGSVNGISNDGKIVIGYFGATIPFTPIDESYIWTEEMGFKDFTAYVKSLGIDVQGEYLYATAISPDGKKFAGYTKTKKTYVLDLTTTLATQNTNKLEVKIYPNPASNVLNISGLKAETKVNIYNAAGQLVKTTTNSKIDINNLPKGSYVVSYDVDGKSTSQKFIKQ